MQAAENVQEIPDALQKVYIFGVAGVYLITNSWDSVFLKDYVYRQRQYYESKVLHIIVVT